MNENINWINEQKIERAINNLQKNNMKAYYAKDNDELINIIKSIVKEGETVSVGGSISLFETKVIDLLRNGKYNFLDRYKEIRTAFFLLLKENGMEIDENAYLTYEMFTEEDPTVANASFRWLVQGKREFLLERTEFLKDQLDSKIA